MLKNTPETSSAACSEKIDAGICDCLRPPPANVEYELSAFQKERLDLQQRISQLEKQLKQSEEEKQKFSAFQKERLESQQRISQLERQLKQSKEEIQNLQADLGRYLFLKEKEKRHEMLLGGVAPVQDPDHPSGQSVSVRRHEIVPGHDANLPEFVPTQDNSVTTVFLPDRHDEELQMSNGTSPTSSKDFVLLQGDKSDRSASKEVETDYDCSQYVSIPSTCSESSDETGGDVPVHMLRIDHAKSNSHSAFGSDKISSDSGLNPTGSKKEERSVDLPVRIQNVANVGNSPWSQQGVFSGTTTDWERLGARPKQGRVQHSLIKQMPGEPFIPVTDGLAGDFLARHTQDKALHDSLYQSVGTEMPLFNDTPSQRASYIDGVRNVSAQRYTANDNVSTTMPEQGIRQEAQKTNLPEMTAGTNASGAFSGTATDWEPQSARPKQGQMPGDPFIPVTDGLAADFLARHTQDKALCDSLYQSVDAVMPLFCDTPSQRASYVDGVRNVSSQRYTCCTANDNVSTTKLEQGIRQEAQKTNLPEMTAGTNASGAFSGTATDWEPQGSEIQEAERWPQQPCFAPHLKCSHCQYEQEIGEDSEKCHRCGNKMSAYFCCICQHSISAENNPYHCEKCGMCRIHKDKSFHCEVCNVCLDKRLLGNHDCRPDSGHDECCFCLKDTFSGCQILPCSHKVHRECAIAMIQYGIRNCPVCAQPLRTVERIT